MFNISPPNLKDKIKIIKSDEPKFYITDGFVTAPRASFVFGDHCPQDTKRFLMECIENGWIKPVAYMKESEYIWETLGE